MKEKQEKLSYEELATFAKKKGFFYQNSEIYGAIAGVYDYGHLGFALKKNFCEIWRRFFLNLSNEFVEIDSGNIMHERVFRASGHLKNFFDPIIKIKDSDKVFRADHLIEEKLGIRAEELTNSEMKKLICENDLLDGLKDEDFEIENLNLMFDVNMGPKKSTKAYLRPETAQGPFVNFKIQHEILRKKIPIGLATIGKAYRNEISPRNLFLRTRELEQAELQIFFDPKKINEHQDFDSIKNYKLNIMFEDKRDSDIEKISCEKLSEKFPKFYVYYMAMVQKFYLEKLNIDQKDFRLYQLNQKERAFYNKIHFDVEVFFKSTNSWIENGGCHYRTDHDLKAHQEESKISHEVFCNQTNSKFIPHVLELSFGVGRNVQFLLDHFYNIDKEKKNVLLDFPNNLAPYKVAVFPLMNKEELKNKAKIVFDDLIEENVDAIFDNGGSIGKRYVRGDEIGIPYTLTIDYQTLEEDEQNQTITIRDKKTKMQKRIKLSCATSIIISLIKNRIKFDHL